GRHGDGLLARRVGPAGSQLVSRPRTRRPGARGRATIGVTLLLRVYYDFASPFCRIALEISRRLEKRYDLCVDWQPFEVIDYLPERGAMPQNPAFVRRGEEARALKL